MECKIGNNIRYLRKCSGMTQGQLAKKLYIKRQTLTNYECGNRLPNLIMATQIADIFDVSLDRLVGRNEAGI